MTLIDGKKIAQDIKNDLKKEIDKFKHAKPTLAVILVGNNPASETYIKMKKKACLEVGIKSMDIKLPKETTQDHLLKEIYKLNEAPNIDGILVQLPLPSHIDERKITFSIHPDKDVDGFHPLNLGKMFLGYTDCFIPCTPLGIRTLLEKENIQTLGKHIVIVGRSNIVGKPLAALLMQKGPDATVSIAHKKTEDLRSLTLSADILITAAGDPRFFDSSYIKKQAVVIDVGINKIVENGKTKIVGDVNFEEVAPIVKKITPVPGGVGPMTIAMLLSNTFDSFCKRR